MNCWKTINFSKHYGTQRLAVLSFITMLLTFILLYIPIAYFFVPATFYDNNFQLLFIGIILMYPFHKLLHYLPVAHLGSKIKKFIEFKFGFYPIIQVKVNEPIPKQLFLLALFMPIFVITALLVWGCILFPHYIHYFTILMALHIGMSLSDFICGRNIISAPKRAYIEEDEEGFQILITRCS